MDWQTIMSNPNFVSQYGQFVTGDPETFWNQLPQEQKEFLNGEFGNVSAPVLNQQTNNQASPVLAGGFDAYGVPIGANMEAEAPNQGFERVMVGGPNGGTSAASVMYNPQTGEVKAVEGDPFSQMISQGANIQAMAQDAYNKNIAAPVQTAQKDLNTMERIVGAAEGDVSGPVLNQYTNAKNNLSSAQQAALSQVSNPSDVDMALGRPSYTTPNMTGLDAFTEEQSANNPMSKPVLSTSTDFTVNNPNQEAARNTNNMNAPAANVPNVDYADPTMAPTNAMTMAMNEEAGRGNIYDGPVLVDTTQPNVTKTDGVLGGTTTGGPSVRSIMSSSGPKTSNRRQSDMPNMLVDRNEALIRIGGAMYSGGLQGDGIGAATREYGAIQDANRATAMEQYKTDQATKLAMAKAAAKGKKGDDTQEAINDTNAQMDSYQSALQAIADSRASGGNLTGVGGIFKSFLDNFTGDEDGARRLILSKVKVDDALLRVAHTKGAISNAEMKLFLSPAPKNYQDEKIWEAWLNERVGALEKVQSRLMSGQEVPDDMKGPNVSDTRAAINNVSGSDDGQFSIKEVTPN
jgi:hypothetical protein